ncbi:unnamed protein product [Calypogeia fissa]
MDLKAATRTGNSLVLLRGDSLSSTDTSDNAMEHKSENSQVDTLNPDGVGTQAPQKDVDVAPDANGVGSPVPETDDDGVALDVNGKMTLVPTADNECPATDTHIVVSKGHEANEECATIDANGLGTEAPDVPDQKSVALDANEMVTIGSEANEAGAETDAGGVVTPGPEVHEETFAVDGLPNVNNESIGKMDQTKLNALAKEFCPSSHPVTASTAIQAASSSTGIGPKKRWNRKKGNPANGGTGWEGDGDSYRIRRTVYVLDINQQFTEHQLAALFISMGCGQVLDCRMWGYPYSQLGFAFVEFIHEDCARRALMLTGMMMDSDVPIRVLPSKTAIVPVNPYFLPQTGYEIEKCSRTVYCTNIDKAVTEADVRQFFEYQCGCIARLRLVGDYRQATLVAFVEFMTPESAHAALNCRGAFLHSRPIRVSPSKTPVRSPPDSLPVK